MRLLNQDLLERDWRRFDLAVTDTPDIDHFCSSSAWVLSSWQALHSEMASAVYEIDGGFLVFGEATHPDGFNYLQPLEASWGLGSPLVGPNIEACVEALTKLPMHHPRAALLLLTGLPRKSQLFLRICQVLGRDLDWQLALGESTRRHIADLSVGAEAFLGRRSKNFRRNLLRAQKRAALRGIVIEPTCQADQVRRDPASVEALVPQWHERIIAIESRSWKGQDGVGINQGSFGAFYQLMMPRLARSGVLRLAFLRDSRAGNRDIGYVLGALFGKTYRGLQFSFDADYADLSLGNLGQWQQIQWLCDEGALEYDLGTDMSYKTRWADSSFTTETILCRLLP